MISIAEAAFSGFVSKVVNNCFDVSWDKIKIVVKNKYNKHQNLESQIYNVTVDVFNQITNNVYKNNQDKIYVAADKLLTGYKSINENDTEVIRSSLKLLYPYVDNDKCMEFKELLYRVLSKDEYSSLYREVILLQEEKERKKIFKIEQKVDKIRDELDDIKNISERQNYIQSSYTKLNILKNDGDIDVSIFISYSWFDREFVDILDNALQKYGYKIIRDIRNAEYAKPIKEFMKEIRNTDYSVIVLSNSFLKSENCMREIFEFIKDENFKDRIIPIILESAKDIWGSSKGITYTIYWKKKEEEFKELLKQIDEESKSGYIEELKHISAIKDSIGEVIGIFRDMKMFDESDNIADDIVTYLKKK